MGKLSMMVTEKVGSADGSKVVGGAVRGGNVGSGVGICDMEGTRETDGWREWVGGTVLVGDSVA